MADPISPASAIAKASTFIVLIGVALIVLGGLSIYSPQISGMTVGVVVGICLILSGLVRTALFWIASSWGAAFLRLALGLVGIIAGGMMIANPETGREAITIAATIYLFADGLLEIFFGFRLPPGSGGMWVMLSGALSVVLGVLIWRGWPYSGEVAVGIYVGIRLIVEGITMILVSLAVRGVAKRVVA